MEKLDILILVIIGVCLFAFVYDFKSRFCQHGVFNGTRIIDGSCKCSTCENERIQDLMREKERQRKKSLQEESEKQYKVMKEEAWAVYKKRIPYKESSIDKMDGFQFENYCAKLLCRMGYSVIQTKKTGDGGKDAFARKDGKTYLVECKHYKPEKKIDRPKLQKLFAAITEEKADGGIFITTCFYTSEALAYGEKYNIQTIDRHDLLRIVEENKDEIDELVYYSLCCPVCGENIEFKYFGEALVKRCTLGHEVPSMFCRKSLSYFNYPSKGIIV